MIYMIAGFVVFFLLLIVSRIINERNVKKLDPASKAKLADAFSKFRKYSLIPVVALILVYFLLIQFVGNPLMLYRVLLGIMLCYILVLNGAVIVKLKSLGMPGNVVFGYVATSVVKLAGLLVFFWVMYSYHA